MGRRGGAADVLALPAQGRARPAASLSCGQSSPVVSKACPSIVGRLILSWDNTTALLPLAAISVHSHGLEPVPTSYQLFLGALSVAPGFMSESHALPFFSGALRSTSQSSDISRELYSQLSKE